MTFVDPGAIGECDSKDAGRTRQRAAERGRATQSLIV